LKDIQDEKFHIQVLNVTEKKYKDPVNKREYYEKYRWVACGGFYVCGAEVGKRILARVKELFVEATNMGFGHGEEMLYLEILDEFDEDIVRSYGDYAQLWNNFKWPTHDPHYIYWAIFVRYRDYGYDKEMFYLCDVVIKMMNNKAEQMGKSSVDEEVSMSFGLPYYMFIEMLDQYNRILCLRG
jgi:hypothetical protein